METKKIVKTVAWVAAGLGITGLGAWGYRQYSLITDFCYAIKKFQIVSFNKDKIVLKFFLRLKNQSGVSVDIKGFDVAVYMNDVKLAVVSDNTKQTWAKNATSEIAFNVTVVFKETKISFEKVATWALWFLSKQTEKLNFKFVVNAKAGLGFITVPVKQFTIEYTLKDLLSENTTPSTCKLDE